MDQNLSAPAGAVNGCPVVFMRQAFRRNDAVLGMNETEIHQLSEETAALRSNVNDNEAGISANVTDIAANNSAAATNATSIGATQVSLTTNTVGIATNTATLAVVTGDYLTSAEQILLQNDTIQNTADIDSVAVDQHLYTKRLQFHQCGGTSYNCTPMECLALCQANGERMAFTDEVLARASEGQNLCSFHWMIERTANGQDSFPVSAYPMYSNRTTSGCGPLNTGDVPRLGGYWKPSNDWASTSTYNCACATLN